MDFYRHQRRRSLINRNWIRINKLNQKPLYRKQVGSLLADDVINSSSRRRFHQISFLSFLQGKSNRRTWGPCIVSLFFLSQIQFIQVIMIYWHSSTILLPSIRQQGPLAIQSSFFLLDQQKPTQICEWDKSKRHWRFGEIIRPFEFETPSLPHSLLYHSVQTRVGGDLYRGGQRPTDDLPSLHWFVAHPARAVYTFRLLGFA